MYWCVLFGLPNVPPIVLRVWPCWHSCSCPDIQLHRCVLTRLWEPIFALLETYQAISQILAELSRGFYICTNSNRKKDEKKMGLQVPLCTQQDCSPQALFLTIRRRIIRRRVKKKICIRTYFDLRIELCDVPGWYS